jgi:hypothetical protein
LALDNRSVFATLPELHPAIVGPVPKASAAIAPESTAAARIAVGRCCRAADIAAAVAVATCVPRLFQSLNMASPQPASALHPRRGAQFIREICALKMQ